MKRVCVLCMFAVVLMPVTAQETAPEGFQHWTAASLQQMMQEQKAEAASNPSHFATRKLLEFPNELFMNTHREMDGGAEWHETQADIFFVESGAATLVVGGTLVEAKQSGEHERRGTSIQGGMREKLSAGDIVRIPAKTAHQILMDGSKEFNYFVIKVKGY